MPLVVPPSFAPVGIIEPSQRILEPTLSTSFPAGTFQSASPSSLAVAYMGQVPLATAYTFVKFWFTAAAGGSPTCEVGIFSSPLPPTGKSQTLTCLAASTVSVSLLSTGSKLSASSMSGTTVPAGTYLWVGLRLSASSTQPTFTARTAFDSNSGVHMLLSGAATGSITTLAASNTYSGFVAAGNVPNMRLYLD